MVQNRPVLAKLSPPRIKHAVPRPRLFETLDRETALWLYGPPGSGKTTLVASYLQQRRLKPLWYQVDSDDREPSTFFHFLGEAKAAVGSRRAALPAVSTESRQDWAAYARRFARALMAALPDDTAMVFDNMQEGGEVLDEILAAMVAEMVEPHRLVLISHRAPPASFVTALAKRQLAVMTADTLRFEPAETEAFARALGVSKSADVARMQELTNGWAAGIVLLANQAGTGLLADVAYHSQGQIQDYISRNVLDWIAERTLRVLESCAFFPDFDAALACAASGDADAGEQIAHLHRDGFFLEQRGTGAGKRYAMHSLLAEVLRNRAGLAGSTTRQVAEATAGRLLLKAGQTEQGISLLLSAQAYGEAAPRILEIAKAMVTARREEQLAAWISSIPKEHLVEQPWLEPWLEYWLPWLEYWRAIATASFDEFTARGVFETVYQRFQAKGDRLGMVLSAAAVLMAIDTGWRSYEGLAKWTDALNHAWTPDVVFTHPEAELRAINAWVFAADCKNLPKEEVDPKIHRQIELVATSDNPNVYLHSGTLLLNHFNIFREFDSGLNLINLIEQRDYEKEASPARAAIWRMIVSMFSTRAGRALNRTNLLTHAAHHRGQAAKLAERHGLNGIRTLLLHADADAALLNSDVETAIKALRAAGELLYPEMWRQLVWYHSHRCRVDLLQERPFDALRQIETALNFAHRAHFMPSSMDTYYSYSATCLAWLGRYDEADAQLEKATHSAGGHRPAIRLTSLLVATRRAIELRSPEIDDSLRAFLRTLRDVGMYQFGHFMPRLIVDLCAHALARGVEPEIAKELVRQRKFLPPPDASSAWPWPIRLEVLGGMKASVWDKPVTFDGKAQRKPMEMLKFLVARTDPSRADKGVRIEDVMEGLWPNADAKDPKGSFDVTVFRLRKLLEVKDAIIVSEGRIRLNRIVVWCDAFDFESAAIKALDGDDTQIGGALELYSGALFGKEEELQWALPATERIATRFAMLVERQGTLLESKMANQDAIDVYRRGINQDNLVEAFYRGLMRCYLAVGEPAEAMRTYRRCRELFSIVLGLKPAPETELLRQRIPA